MIDKVYLGFDFGYKRIGMAVGQKVTCSARPLATIKAIQGKPQWLIIKRVIDQWHPAALIVGLPTCINGQDQYTTEPAKAFAYQLTQHFDLPTHLTDERLSTVEARSQLFAQGGYHKISTTAVDSIAACIILEQWLQMHLE